jgi:hypothetical protein
VVIVVEDDAVDLVDPGDTRAFHVEVRGDVDVAAVLDESGAGRLADDGEHALIEIGWVRQQAVGVGPGWDQEFEGMLDFARTKGWIDEGSSAIVAHLERVE